MSDSLQTVPVQPAPDIDCTNYLGQTPLYLAAREGHEDATETLLAHGACAAVEDAQGLTPFAAAALNGGCTRWAWFLGVSA